MHTNRPTSNDLREYARRLAAAEAIDTDLHFADLCGFAVVELCRGHIECAEQALMRLTDEQLTNLVNAGLLLSRNAARVLAVRPVDSPHDDIAKRYPFLDWRALFAEPDKP